MGKRAPVRRLPAALSPARKVFLAEAIADKIAHAIAERQLRPGDKIVEVALAEQMNVSRVPVREALKVLATQGVLRGGRQSYQVADFNEHSKRQLRQVRVALEALLLRDAIENYRTGASPIEPLDNSLGRMREAVRQNSREAFRNSDLQFHREISLAARNEITRTLWENTARHVLIVLNVPKQSKSDLMELARRHQQLREFIAAQIFKPGQLQEVQTALEHHFLDALASVEHLG